MTDDYDAADNARKCYDVAIAAMREKLHGFRQERIGDCWLINADCKEVLPLLPKVDAVVTDPPYGIGADEAVAKNKGKWGWKFHGSTSWDRERPDKIIFDLMLGGSKHQIIWGGNYFSDYLPPTMHWLMWDKGQMILCCPDLMKNQDFLKRRSIFWLYHSRYRDRLRQW
jgi:hypothetical protein